MSKKVCLVDLTSFLKDFQSSKLLVILYLFKAWLHSLFHHCLKYFVILIHLAFFSHVQSILDLNKLTRFSSLTLSVRFEVLRFLIITEASLTKATSSLLPFGIESLNKVMNSSVIGIVIVRGAWSDNKYQSEWIEWLLSSVDPLHKNIRSTTELDSLLVLEYLVDIGLIRINKSKLKELAMIIRSSLIEKWYGNEGSHKLSLMLKLPVMISMLLTLTSVSLRYFKAEWEESE